MTTKYSILAVYGHPDDEQGVSGLMAHYARLGMKLGLVCCTRGEAGEIAPGVDADQSNLGRVREEELRCAAEKIGVQNLYFLDYRDSGMQGTAENNDPRSLWQANPMEVAEKVVRIVRRHKPHVMLTFDPNGGYGHPDHIKAHQVATMAYYLAGDPRVFPDQVREGLEPWAPLKLYWGAFPRSRFQRAIEAAEKIGLDLGIPIKEFLKRGIPDECVTTRINVADFVDLKLSALYCHASQINPAGIWQNIPQEIRRKALEVETLILAESRVEPLQGIEDDLFARIT